MRRASQRSMKLHEKDDQSRVIRAMKGQAGMVVNEMLREVLAHHASTLQLMAGSCQCDRPLNCNHVGLSIAAGYLMDQRKNIDSREEALRVEQGEENTQEGEADSEDQGVDPS